MTMFFLLLGGVAITVLLIAYNVFAKSFVFLKLWSWFILPVVHVEISMLTAAGIIFAVALFSNNKPDKVKGSEAIPRFIGELLEPWLILLIAYATKLIMGV